MAGDPKEGPGFTLSDPPEASGEDAGALPRIDFSSFVLSLATSALYHLGIAGDPETGQANPEPDLALARQTIETLEMLGEKTRGNLEDAEAKLLQGMLYELRMGFVEAGKK